MGTSMGQPKCLREQILLYSSWQNSIIFQKVRENDENT